MSQRNRHIGQSWGMADAKLSLSSPMWSACVTLLALMGDSAPGALPTREAHLSLSFRGVVGVVFLIFKKFKMYNAFDLLSVQNPYWGSFVWT